MKRRLILGCAACGAGLALFLWSLVPVLAGERTDKMDSKPEKIVKSNAEWKKVLTPLQYKILRKKGTERAGTGKFTKHKADGIYTCAGCGAELFTSSDKYDSGCGWPSFTQPKADQQVDEKPDRSYGMVRTEVVCSRCDGHLGHVFNDGPRPTGQRYCINSASLDFNASDGEPAKKDGAKTELATFGAGCFWCSEAVFEGMDGVKSVVSGYSGGKTANPTYEAVCSGRTGHAEVIQVEFDPEVVAYEKLLRMFWKMHDPTTPNRQGGDVGTQYRSAVFYHSGAQKLTAEAVRASLEKAKAFRRPIVTEISPATTFYKAEDYHQDYFKNNPDKAYCRRVIAPKLKKLGRK